MRRLYDISVALGSESIDYPDDTPFQRKMVQTLERGDECNLSEIEMSVHAGTHLDAPGHFIKSGKTIDQFPVQRFIVPALVVDISNRIRIEPAELENTPVQPGEAILFKTRNSKESLADSGIFREDFVYLSEEGADWCLRKAVGLVGIDYVSIEPFADKGSPVHHKLLDKGILILEGINLKEVPVGSYTLYCFPLKISNSEGAPVRAVLMA